MDHNWNEIQNWVKRDLPKNLNFLKLFTFYWIENKKHFCVVLIDDDPYISKKMMENDEKLEISDDYHCPAQPATQYL